MKLSLFPFIVFLTFACSTTPKETVEPVTYSAETMKTFEEIEREQVLEYYRQLRARENQATQRVAPPPETPKPLQKFHTQKPSVRKAPAPAPRPVRSSIIAANPEELEKEISQNLSFFCMRTRSQKRFSSEGSCEEFTANVETQCRDQFQPNDRRLFNCVRDRLK
jgi:hypothetical protein